MVREGRGRRLGFESSELSVVALLCLSLSRFPHPFVVPFLLSLVPNSLSLLFPLSFILFWASVVNTFLFRRLLVRF